MNVRFIVFDLDGTLVKTKSGDVFRRDAQDWMWIPGRREMCKKLVASGVRLAIATNQGGVAFPWSKFSPLEIEQEIAIVARHIGALDWRACFHVPNVKALPEFFHPNHPDRKPNPGMISSLVEEYHMDLSSTMYVGDREEDKQAAANAGCEYCESSLFFALCGMCFGDEK